MDYLTNRKKGKKIKYKLKTSPSDITKKKLIIKMKLITQKIIKKLLIVQ